MRRFQRNGSHAFPPKHSDDQRYGLGHLGTAGTITLSYFVFPNLSEKAEIES